LGRKLCWSTGASSRISPYREEFGAHFFDADSLAGKDRAEVNLFAAQTDASAIGDDNDLVVERIVDVGQSLTQPDRKGLFASLVEFDLKDIFVILEIRVACKDGPAAS
jgi:hypothetical protein